MAGLFSGALPAPPTLRVMVALRAAPRDVPYHLPRDALPPLFGTAGMTPGPGRLGLVSGPGLAVLGPGLVGPRPAIIGPSAVVVAVPEGTAREKNQRKSANRISHSVLL